jgi:hypothetical protein
MPNRSVAGYTQVPVAASDILRVVHDRLNAAGTVTQVTVDYQVRDDTSTVRFQTSLGFQSGAYPASGASIVAACNAAQGT